MTNNTEQDTVKVVIFERRPRLAIGMAKIMEKSKIITVVGRADTLERLEELVETLSPDVVMLDADRPGWSLAEICENLKREKNLGVVLFSTEGRNGPLKEAMSAGADALVTGAFHPRDLVLAVVHAAQSNAGPGRVAVLPMVETFMRSDRELDTDRLAPLMEWAASPSAELISPRLRPGAG
jgi:DNA-binding NarL/FixJ family response regulator